MTEPSPSGAAFPRSVQAFARLGVVVRPMPVPADTGLPGGLATYRAIAGAIRDAEADTAAWLDDASRVERAAYELGLFGRLLRASMAGEPPPPPDGDTFATAPSVRRVRTQWDWDGFLADPAQSRPDAGGGAWMLRLPPSGPVQVQRLQPLPALLLDAFAHPLTLDAAVDVIAAQVEADRGPLRAVVRAQVEVLRASGILRPFAATAARHTVDEMRRLLLADEVPHATPRSLVGLLARAVRPARESARAARDAADGTDPVLRLDESVAALEQMLAGARLRDAFSDALDGYWAATDVAARIAHLSPLLDALDRALGSGVHARPPYVVSP